MIENVSDAIFLWERLFSEIANEHALLKIKRAKESKTPWVTSTLPEMKRDKDSHFRKARFTNRYLPLKNVQKSAEFY